MVYSVLCTTLVGVAITLVVTGVVIMVAPHVNKDFLQNFKKK
jgi:hypothetical protein